MVSDPGSITPASDRPWWAPQSAGDRRKRKRDPERDQKEMAPDTSENDSSTEAAAKEARTEDKDVGRILDIEA